MAGVKGRHTVANYLNVGKDEEKYVLMGAGFTELNETPSAQTSSKRYVNDKSATKSITGYDWSAPFNTDQVRSQEAIEFIFNIGEMQLVGADCETDYVIVDLEKQVGDTAGAYKARKFRVAIEVADFPNNEGELAATGNLQGIGDPVAGSFNVTTKTFTAGSGAQV